MKDNFSFIHSLVYHTIDTWTYDTTAKAHDFYSKWCQAKYHGLKPTTDWNKTKAILHCHHYGDYITFVQQCPLINKTYGIAWDTHNNILHYRIRNKPQTEYYNYLSDKATLHYQQMQHTAHNFEKEVHRMDTHMEEIDTKLLYWEQHATHQVTKGHDQITK